MRDVIEKIREELIASADPAAKESGRRFFKEPVDLYGVKTGIVTKIAKTAWKVVKEYDKPEIFSLCEELYRSGKLEESFVVSEWGHAFNAFTEKQDFDRFLSWINRYISNWASCDGFCNHAVGDILMKFPELVDRLYGLAESENCWARRASAVSLILPVRKGHFVREAFMISDILLRDPEDLVQKGYGWLLKEASRLHQQEVFDYVLKHKQVMPRTALRYAIELMPEAVRKVAMEKEKAPKKPEG
ncbi:MAG TPA: DNA alkylation repair protein [Thermotogota bacterium]|nr:DNA alkylation repair protein [Thermotogota bacterium]HNT95563.1 DNA alkylation repair protein [Thermotogota bacterium]HPB86953.1 DNA alkylation repair protein [Thermotogota bacterium]HQN22458.1 DNA alkylation repair protein [Thermotogota bacterium]HQQ65816.1 DNA alkylation repair protein [Thermotogota bacterium]